MMYQGILVEQPPARDAVTDCAPSPEFVDHHFPVVASTVRLADPASSQIDVVSHCGSEEGPEGSLEFAGSPDAVCRWVPAHTVGYNFVSDSATTG